MVSDSVFDRMVNAIIMVEIIKLLGSSAKGEIKIDVEAKNVEYYMPSPNKIVLRPNVVAVTSLESVFSEVESNVVDCDLDSVARVEILSVNGTTLSGEVSELS